MILRSLPGHVGLWPMCPILKMAGYARRGQVAACRQLDGGGDGQEAQEAGQGDGGDIEDVSDGVGDGFFLRFRAEIVGHGLLL